MDSGLMWDVNSLGCLIADHKAARWYCCAG